MSIRIASVSVVLCVLCVSVVRSSVTLEVPVEAKIADAPPTSAEKNAALENVRMLKLAKERILREVQKVIVGQTEVIEQVLIALCARGHCLLVGVPGLAKTL